MKYGDRSRARAAVQHEPTSPADYVLSLARCSGRGLDQTLADHHLMSCLLTVMSVHREQTYPPVVRNETLVRFWKRTSSWYSRESVILDTA